ncbi:MAG: hypothetical protein ACYC5O_17240, partial [Anaerolineae bacterium]
MPLSERENYLRNATFRRPEWIPCQLYVSDASWDQLRGELEAVAAHHPMLFPDFEPGRRQYDHFAPAQKAGEDYTDAWGCTWSASIDGFENLMLDMAAAVPELDQLIATVGAHDEALVRRWLDLDIDLLNLADDLGSQRAAVVSPQDLVNGLGDLERQVKGKRCIRLDIDRQEVVPFGSPGAIHSLIEEEVRRLGSEQGGLELVCGIYPPTPPENIDAVCAAMEAMSTYWWS